MYNEKSGPADAVPISWYAIRTFNSQEQRVSKYLETCSLKNFIPMRRFRTDDEDGKTVWKSQPIVHNLIFVQKSLPKKEIERIFKECPFPIKVYRREDEGKSWCEIADSEMIDLRMICDKSYCEPRFLETSEIKEGRPVRVIHGPLAGLRGKMVRKSKKYYIVKSFGYVSLEVTVSRWCCISDEENDTKEKENQKK
ncbi:MAG: UpxY family transcription antiterminator [Bacteroidaceae bacterium]|nr:UpxY family transcription antiterminator [Bacteroidaceae bacterium]